MTTVYGRSYKHILSDRERAELLREELSDLVGQQFTFAGCEPGDPEPLYSRRVGQPCVVVGFSEDRVRCPLVVQFPDSFRGIAEREWLREIRRAVA